MTNRVLLNVSVPVNTRLLFLKPVQLFVTAGIVYSVQGLALGWKVRISSPVVDGIFLPSL